MFNKEKFIDYVVVLIENRKIINQYQELLGDSLTIYDAIYDTEVFISTRLFNIPEEIEDNVIREFVWWITSDKNQVFAVYDENNNLITTITELASYVERLMEAAQ